MARVKTGSTTHRRHKKMLERTKGFKHGRNNLFRLAHQAVLKADSNAFRDRKAKKRSFRSHWIVVLNAAANANGISYNRLMNGLKKAEITLNRRVLSELASTHPNEFQVIMDKAKAAI